MAFGKNNQHQVFLPKAISLATQELVAPENRETPSPGCFDQVLDLGSAQQHIGLGIANFFDLIMSALSGLVELVGQIIKIRGFE